MHTSTLPSISEAGNRHLATFPRPLELRASPVIPFAIAIPAMAFCGFLGFVFSRYGEQMLAASGVLVALFFAFMALSIVFAVTAWWFASDIPRGRAVLKLDEDGFKASLFFRRVRKSWEQAGDFTYHPGIWPFARITYLDRGARGSVRRTLPGTGFHYGIQSADLVDLMNTWRALAQERAGTHAAQ